jgi:hypothetical protein
VTEILRTDFIAVPTKDRERAAAFYGDTLVLHKRYAPYPDGTTP